MEPEKAPRRTRTRSAGAKKPTGVPKPWTEEDTQALAKYRSVHGEDKKLADVRADGGVARWAEWGGEVSKMPSRAPRERRAPRQTRGRSNGARDKPSEEEARALAKYRGVHGEAKTLTDVVAGGGVASWAEWGGEVNKMPGPALASPALSDLFAAAGGTSMPPMPADARSVEGLEQGAMQPPPAPAPLAAPAPREAPRAQSEEEARALARYRSVHGEDKTLAHVRADGGVAQWAQWAGEASKQPAKRPTPPMARCPPGQMPGEMPPAPASPATGEQQPRGRAGGAGLAPRELFPSAVEPRKRRPPAAGRTAALVARADGLMGHLFDAAALAFCACIVAACVAGPQLF